MSKKKLAYNLNISEDTLLRTTKSLINRKLLEKNELAHLRAIDWEIREGPYIIIDHLASRMGATLEQSAIMASIMTKMLLEQSEFVTLNITKMSKCLNIQRTYTHRLIKQLEIKSLIIRQENEFSIYPVIAKNYYKNAQK